MAIKDIKEVPKTPHSGFMQTYVYNPTNEDFTHSWNGEPYTLHAGKTEGFPEFIAYHLAKHLAKKIVSAYHEFKIKKESVGQLTPDTAKSIPQIEVQEMRDALIKGEGAFQKGNVPILEVKVGTPTAEIKTEEVKSDIPATQFKCEICGFVAKSKLGLASHKRFKHPAV